ncbi:type I-E CRISPR-associated protein Cse2/CasB [Paenirhodobacter enshiensis]|uniref:CRISPR-associated protein Cse2 n=1 Tax=Paenirhodobacter enshiensis TaxID=1105367 RepID=A0A086XQB1_9RHOB|nr:type I-E CRISPR-associated protein Cse2/CasB [Paenirhodobacter enshiensis]KFI24211.1 hypothetical protein CG50_13430 [Paenirhodobacter enshiensis]
MTKDQETKRPGQIILAWWAHELGERTTGSQKALSAQLRRADDVSVLCHKPVHELAHALNIRDGAKIARLARVLAHVRSNTGANLPRKLGAGDPPVLSALRFERLIHSEGADLETAIRRALPMVGYAANVAHLGEALLFWTDKTRTKWCFDYYGTDAPEDSTAEDVSA